MSGRKVSGRWVMLVGFSAFLLGLGVLDQRPTLAQEPNTAGEKKLGSPQTIDEVRSLVADLEVLVAAQQEQLLRSETSLTRTRGLLKKLQGITARKGLPAFSSEEERRRHSLLAAQAVVDKMEWKWSDDRTLPFYSAEHLEGGYKVEITPPPEFPWALTFRVTKDGKDLYFWKGHYYSVFAQANDVLYVADFHFGMPGCTLVAHDLKAGKRLWTTSLWGVGHPNNSQYRNRINIELTDGRLVIYGNEIGGAYFEILNPQTGEWVGHKRIHGEIKRP